MTPEPALQPGLAAAVAGVLVAVLPRAGWLLAAAATTFMLALGPAPRPGAALLVAALVAGPPLLLRADGRSWSLPALAPALGLLGLAGAYPALAGRAPRWPRGSRSGRSAPGGSRNRCAAPPARPRALVFGPAAGTPPRPSFDGAAGIAAGDVLANACSSGALLLALIWGAAALVCPWMVRGRSLSADVAGAACWAAAVAAATVALGEALGDRVAQAVPHGLVPGAVVAAALALVLAHARRPAGPDPETQRG